MERLRGRERGLVKEEAKRVKQVKGKISMGG